MPESTSWSFDNGYFSGSNLRFLEQKGIEGYIPDSKQEQKQKGKESKDGPFAKDAFEYDEEKDLFRCPWGECLTRKGDYTYNGKRIHAYYGANCRDCPFKSDCAVEGRKRVITGDDYEAERRRMTAKMRSAGGKAAYQKRKETVEWVFGDVTQNQKFREFLT